jgi:hypothetical protein
MQFVMATAAVRPRPATGTEKRQGAQMFRGHYFLFFWPHRRPSEWKHPTYVLRREDRHPRETVEVMIVVIVGRKSLLGVQCDIPAIRFPGESALPGTARHQSLGVVISFACVSGLSRRP